MNIDQVRLYRLSVVIEEGNLSKAAQRLGLSQPALSASLAQLEQELGVKLLDRGRHGATPTVFGTALYERSKVIESELRRAAQDVDELAGARTGHLAVGAASGTAVSVVCLAVSRLMEQRPGVFVVLDEDWSEDVLLSKLRRRELDLVISPPIESRNGDDIEDERIFKTRRVIAVRATHPAIKDKRADIAEILKYPLVAPEQSHVLRRYLEDIFFRMGVAQPRVGMVGNSLALAKQIVANSDHFAVFSEVSILDEVKSGTFKTFDLAVPTEFWYRILRNSQVSLRPTARLFLRELNAVCRSQGLRVSSTPRSKGR